MLPVDTYEKIAEPDLKEFRIFPDAILQDLSADQCYLYQIVKSITTGTLDPAKETTKPGPMNYSQCFTLANKSGE